MLPQTSRSQTQIFIEFASVSMTAGFHFSATFSCWCTAPKAGGKLSSSCDFENYESHREATEDGLLLSLSPHGTDNNARASMSRKGDCYDNAPMESFYRTLKVEHVYWQDFATRAEAQRSRVGEAEAGEGSARRAEEELGRAEARTSRLACRRCRPEAPSTTPAPVLQERPEAQGRIATPAVPLETDEPPVLRGGTGRLGTGCRPIDTSREVSP